MAHDSERRRRRQLAACQTGTEPQLERRDGARPTPLVSVGVAPAGGPEPGQGAPTAGIELPRDPASAGSCRRWLRQLLAGEQPEVRDVVLLLASEAVTNAVLHARTPVGIRVELDGERVRVEVSDGDAGRLPQARRGERQGASGRGLGLIASLSRRWGVRSLGEAGGKQVWFEVSRTVPAAGGSVPPGDGAREPMPAGDTDVLGGRAIRR